MAENRIKEWRQRRALSQQGLADTVGTSKSQIDKLEKNARRLTVDWMVRLAKALACDPRELLPQEILLPNQAPEQLPQAPTLPIKKKPDGETIDIIPCPPTLTHTKGAYSLYVMEGEMAPMYRMGQLLFIAPNKPPREGSGIIVLLRNGNHILREYAGKTKEGIKVRSYAPQREQIIALAEITALHAIVGATEPQ